MICIGFLAGANLQEGDPEALLLAVHRLVGMLPAEQKEQVLKQVGATAWIRGFPSEVENAFRQSPITNSFRRS